jgi:hypothetical protein
LVRCSDAELARHDVAAMNLACARGLPGAEEIDDQGCLKFLDRCAWAVRKETGRISSQFQRRPDAFNHSWGHFRCIVLVTVLQRDVGIRYNPALVNRQSFSDDSRDIFLHGIVKKGVGSCASLPVFYAAVGRRLNYPLRLVATRSHLFCRWEDEEERFNVEATNLGMGSFPDDYYRTGIYAITKAEEEEYGFLKTMTVRQELADFLAQRGFCRLGGGRHKEALKCFAWAAVVSPDGGPRAVLRRALDGWAQRLQAATPPGFPRVVIKPLERQLPALPVEWEEQVVLSHVKEDLHARPELRQDFTGQGGRRPPTEVVVDFPPRMLWQI